MNTKSKFSNSTSKSYAIALYELSKENALLDKVEEEIEDGTTIETLRQIKFSKPIDFLDNYDQDQQEPESDINMVEYFFDILVDDEIDDEVLCKHDPVKEKTGVFAESRTKICQDVINEQKKKVFDIYTDESDSPGEIC